MIEPIFETSKGWFIASYEALGKFRKLNPSMWRNWNAHHIIEKQHLELFPALMRGWNKETMPCVLLPPDIHLRSVASELKRLLPLPLPKRPVGQSQVQLVFDAYMEVYIEFLQNADELLAIVKTMLRL